MGARGFEPRTSSLSEQGAVCLTLGPAAKRISWCRSEEAFRLARPFKAVNDRCGHAEGDRLLQRLVAAFAATLRSVDTPARLGGDEFAVLMPETGSRAASQLTGRLMEALATETTGEGLPLTCSCGLVTFRLPPASSEVLLEAGDRLMYEAKAAGKNRLCRAVLPAVRTAHAGERQEG